MASLLDNFASTENIDIFPNATRLPAFFENNLVDPSRVVKHFLSDPQANIRVFYYQYLKLCFELENVDFEGYIRKIEDIINNQEFKFMFFEDDNPQIFNDLQFKQLIMEFFGVLGQGGTGIQQAINYYPIMDTVFIYFFRAILILTGKTDALDSYIQREELFQFLCNYFNVQITTHERCIKFVSTDIFVYEENPGDVYMAYIQVSYDEGQGQIQNQPENQEHYEQNIQQPKQIIQSLQPEQIIPAYHPSGPASQSSRSQRGTSQNNKSYISSQFIDYTNINANLQNLVKKDNLKLSGEIPNQHSFGKILPQTQKQVSNFDKFETVSKNEPYSVQSFQAVNYSYNQNNNYTSSTPYNPYLSLNENTLNYKSNQYNKQPYSQTPFSKKIQQNSYSSQNWGATPTKDPGFSQYNTLNNTTYQVENLVTQKKYTDNFEEKYGIKKPVSYTNYEEKFEIKKPVSSVESSSKPPSNYNYSNNASNNNNYSQPTSYISGSNASMVKPGSNYNNPPPIYKPASEIPASGLSTSKSSYLNVSLEFTNSFTMKVMAQPHKTNVKNIRNRAREHRKSLINIIK